MGLRTRLLVVVLVVLVVGALASFGAAQADGNGQTGKPYRIALEPSVAGSNGSGTAIVRLNQGQGTVCWDITVQNLTSPVILDHIHVGDAGVNGPIVVDFKFPTLGLQNCVNADPALIKQIRQDPSHYYVNVHTTMFPLGEIRGQLSD